MDELLSQDTKLAFSTVSRGIHGTKSFESERLPRGDYPIVENGVSEGLKNRECIHGAASVINQALAGSEGVRESADLHGLGSRSPARATSVCKRITFDVQLVLCSRQNSVCDR